MADFERDPRDTPQLHLDLASDAVTRGKNANRSYLFAMSDRIEIAFGHVRMLKGHSDETERTFSVDYHTGIVLDFHAARALQSDLANLLRLIEEEDKEQDA